MQNETFPQRIGELYRMLFELSTGNLVYRIPDSNQDELGKLSESLNAFAAQMHLAIRKSGYVLPYPDHLIAVHMALILDAELKVIGYTANAPETFGHTDNLLGKRSLDLLYVESHVTWAKIIPTIQDQKDFSQTITLHFETATGQVLPARCFVHALMGTGNILLNVITTTTQEISKLNQNAGTDFSEARLIQDLYQYIMENLEKPLQTLPELALRFKTNEFKLKNGFRRYFKSGIHSFYNSQRLQRALLLIQQTSLPLKSIAFRSGFSDYGTFSKAFKKHFGYPPTKVSRG